MISLSSLLTPSLLLYCEDLKPDAKALSEECQEICAEDCWAKVEQIAQKAEDLQKAGGDWIGCAVTLLRLGDLCRKVGKLGPAQRFCEQARKIFHRYQFVPEQRYNEAVATYALGLVSQSLGDEREAQRFYEQALQLFERARKHWQAVGKTKRARCCEQVSLWIERLIEHVRYVRSRGKLTASSHSVFICPWPIVSQKECLAADLEVGWYIPVSQAHIGDHAFQVYSTEYPTLTLKPGEGYCVVKVPERGMPDASLEKGDYALIQEGEDAEGIAVTLDEHGEVLFGRFERLEDGSIRFTPSDPNKPPRIIGDPDELLTGVIVGSLKLA
ncbi:MAG: hypothetical protein H8E35_14510 [Ardenticatenia bacterium]|nr:hypothetical protein [Ardenticatenia bacterium]